MHLIDSHCHLNDETLFPNRKEIISNAEKEGVALFIVPGWDYESSRRAVGIAHEFNEVYAAIGFHPENLENISENMISKIKELASDPKVVAIGEIGLDYHWFKEKEEHDIQKKWFVRQIDLANELKLPVSIHARDASEDLLALLKEYPIISGAVLHCYSGSTEQLKEFSKLGYCFGFDGPVTYKNARVPKQNAIDCPLDKILIETDSPYLPPVPHRGETNYPSYVKLVVEEIARLRNMDVEELVKKIDENTERLFHVELKYE